MKDDQASMEHPFFSLAKNPPTAIRHYEHSGALAPLRNFRGAIKKLAESNHLPEYWLRFDRKDDKLAVYPHSNKGGWRQLKDILRVKAL